MEDGSQGGTASVRAVLSCFQSEERRDRFARWWLEEERGGETAFTAEVARVEEEVRKAASGKDKRKKGWLENGLNKVVDECKAKSGKTYGKFINLMEEWAGGQSTGQEVDDAGKEKKTQLPVFFDLKIRGGAFFVSQTNPYDADFFFLEQLGGFVKESSHVPTGKGGSHKKGKSFEQHRAELAALKEFNSVSIVTPLKQLLQLRKMWSGDFQILSSAPDDPALTEWKTLYKSYAAAKCTLTRLRRLSTSSSMSASTAAQQESLEAQHEIIKLKADLGQEIMSCVKAMESTLELLVVFGGNACKSSTAKQRSREEECATFLGEVQRIRMLLLIKIPETLKGTNDDEERPERILRLVEENVQTMSENLLPQYMRCSEECGKSRRVLIQEVVDSDDENDYEGDDESLKRTNPSSHSGTDVFETLDIEAKALTREAKQYAAKIAECSKEMKSNAEASYAEAAALIVACSLEGVCTKFLTFEADAMANSLTPTVAEKSTKDKQRKGKSKGKSKKYTGAKKQVKKTDDQHMSVNNDETGDTDFTKRFIEAKKTIEAREMTAFELDEEERQYRDELSKAIKASREEYQTQMRASEANTRSNLCGNFENSAIKIQRSVSSQRKKAVAVTKPPPITARVSPHQRKVTPNISYKDSVETQTSPPIATANFVIADHPVVEATTSCTGREQEGGNNKRAADRDKEEEGGGSEICADDEWRHIQAVSSNFLSSDSSERSSVDNGFREPHDETLDSSSNEMKSPLECQSNGDVGVLPLYSHEGYNKDKAIVTLTPVPSDDISLLIKSLSQSCVESQLRAERASQISNRAFDSCLAPCSDARTKRTRVLLFTLEDARKDVALAENELARMRRLIATGSSLDHGATSGDFDALASCGRQISLARQKEERARKTYEAFLLLKSFM